MQNSLEQYINKKSFWHATNPTVKILVTFFLITIVFLPIGFFGLLIATGLIALIWVLARLPLRLFKSIFITWVVMFLLLGIINWIAYKSPGFSADILNSPMNVIFGDVTKFDPNHIIWTQDHNHMSIVGNIWGGEIDRIIHYEQPDQNLPYKYESVKIASGQTLYLWYISHWYTLSTKVIFNTTFVSFKIILMISIITVLLSTTSYSQLTNGIEDLLYPLKYFRVPVNEWAMTFAIAIRFVPSLLSESQNILRAQASRGVDFRNGNFKDKVKSLVSLIIPMFSLAFHKADDLSNAMEARSYDPRKIRTRYRNYNISARDFVALLLGGILFAFFIAFTVRHMVFGPFNWVEFLIV